MPKYQATGTEEKWQKKWEETGLYKVDLEAKDRPKYYNLVMFPYPSGDKLHIGHWYNFAPADSWGRYMRMKGYRVFEPMGYDSFGLPAENFAIKTGIKPADSIAKNTATMTTQLKRIGTMYDWSKTLSTSAPEYYHWTQWVFLQLYNAGLAYQKEAAVNWDPVDQTVLANEQVLPDGRAERSGAIVEQRLLKQWFFKITDFSQKLLDNLEKLDWPEKTKAMQRNWIGRSEGAEIRFAVDGLSGAEIEVFTTRPDTLFGVTYVVLAPEHPLVDKITSAKQKKDVEKYRKDVGTKNELARTDLAKEKTGVFTGGYALHPVTGAKIPVWIADYVLMTYGTGAVMAVPAHDERDWDFAKKYELPVVEVVSGGDIGNSAFVEDGEMVNSDFLDGLSSGLAKKKITEWLQKNKRGKGVINYRLRDWLLSRQRYWGAPIPIVYDPEGKPHAIPEKHLPWMLPTDVDFKPKGSSPLGQSEELMKRTEKIFGKGWKPEIDTMDTFVCSSFYYLRYLMEGNQKNFIDAAREKQWMPVDMYIGGPEHACMHLIYARFLMMALNQLKITKEDEPFKRLVHQGLITNAGAKMSKSKGNVVSPDDYVAKYGSDIFRMYLMFMGPYTEGGDWNDSGISGVARFVDRFFALITEKSEVKDETEMLKQVHRTIKKVSEDIVKLNFNTCVAALMEFVNYASKTGLDDPSKRLMVKLIAPLAPHLAEELWEQLGEKYSVFDQEYPTYDAKYLVESTIKIAIQVNGKLRGEIAVAAEAVEAEVLASAKAETNVSKYLAEGQLVKEIYVKGKLVSFVVKAG